MNGQSVIPRLPAHLSRTASGAAPPQTTSGQATTPNEESGLGRTQQDAAEEYGIQSQERDHEPLPPRLHPRPSQRVVIPPPNFGMVEDGLYRSGQPSELNFPFLEKLRLKAVVWLAPEDPGGRL